jgi:alpha-galactosidase
MLTDFLRYPDRVNLYSSREVICLSHQSEGKWTAKSVKCLLKLEENSLKIFLTSPKLPVSRLCLRWQTEFPEQSRFLGDSWERSYGELEWRGLFPERVMPWYMLIYDGKLTHGLGVKTRSRSFCFWQTDAEGVSLWLDVRCGSVGVQLGTRTLEAATVVFRRGEEGETPFQAAQAFCQQLCTSPRLPSHPVYGGNNWYHAYGKSSATQILDEAKLISDLSPNPDNRPYMVIDDGWQICREPGNGGPWCMGNAKFPDMAALASQIQAVGAKPGLWFRPLLTAEYVPQEWKLGVQRQSHLGIEYPLDPSQPEVLELIRNDMQRFLDWGYQLIKHDFTAWDIFGRWGRQTWVKPLGAELTDDGWTFSDRSRTTAEIILELYQALRESAGDAILIGCNTVNHLGAGFFELQRIGDDTSGLEWERTRRMGINSLAFRIPQHQAFHAVDADCVGLTPLVPWEKNQEWLTLVAQSGTPLFVSANPASIKVEQRQALERAFTFAAKELPPGEPLDWLYNTCPRRWKLNGEEVTFNWFDTTGAWVFTDL